MNQVLSAAIPLVLMCALFVFPLYVLIWLRGRYRRGRRSPLTTKLLRGPGHTLREEIQKVEENFSAYLAMLLMFPFMVYSIHLSQSYFGAAPESAFRWMSDGLFVLAVVITVSIKLHRWSRTKFALQCGLEAEIAMGQELDQLMRRGAAVFHDIPADHFNIDHVVVTSAGVFAVETKGRMKPDGGRGKQDAKVEYNGERLLFPDWQDVKTVEQARRQAAWLGKWISKGIGECVQARAVVALPGWFVERTGRGDVLVISGREASALLKATTATSLDEQAFARIANQLEERCRNVEPTQYGRQTRFGSAVQKEPISQEP